MTSYIYGHRQACNMAGMHLNMHGKGRGSASKTNGPNAGLIYLPEKFLFQGGHIHPCIGLSHRSQQRLVRNDSSLLKVSAYAHPHDYGRTWICTCIPYRIHNKLLYTFYAVSRTKHL